MLNQNVNCNAKCWWWWIDGLNNSMKDVVSWFAAQILTKTTRAITSTSTSTLISTSTIIIFEIVNMQIKIMLVWSLHFSRYKLFIFFFLATNWCFFRFKRLQFCGFYNIFVVLVLLDSRTHVYSNFDEIFDVLWFIRKGKIVIIFAVQSSKIATIISMCKENKPSPIK